MPRILLFAATTGYQTRSFAEAARRLGVDVILATDRCHIMEDPWGDAALAIRFEAPEESAELVADDIRRRGVVIDGILAVADRPTRIAALVAARMGLPWHSEEAAAASRDKHRMRVLFEQARLLVPRYGRVPLAADPRSFAATAEFPCVLKPLGLSGSRGVIRANDAAEFIGAFERIRQILTRPELHNPVENDEAHFIQVEQYIPGREFALEGVMSRGDLWSLALFDKPDPLEGPFFEETIYVTPSREAASTQRAITETVTKAARALGLWHGPVHAEVRVNGGGVFMLEIAARPIGGLCARALRFRTPERELISLEELLVLHAIGQMPAEYSAASASAGVMMIPVPRAGVLQAVHGVDAALALPGVEDVVITAKPGETLVPLPEGASYTGFLFARGPDAQATEESLRKAHGALRFDILSALSVLR